jgi:hypothetical protein
MAGTARRRRAKRILIIAAIVIGPAAALGAGGAKHLDPFGANDPGTESVLADQRLQDAGFRETGVVVLLNGT